VVGVFDLEVGTEEGQGKWEVCDFEAKLGFLRCLWASKGDYVDKRHCNFYFYFILFYF
jgi:hypothetical protein